MHIPMHVTRFVVHGPFIGYSLMQHARRANGTVHPAAERVRLVVTLISERSLWFLRLVFSVAFDTSGDYLIWRFVYYS